MSEIKEDLKEIKELLSENKASSKKDKEKKFRIPSFSKVSNQLVKKNYVTIMKINENGNVDFSKQPIVDQTVLIDGIPRLAAAGYVVYYNKNPMIIIPSWSVEPFSPLEHYEKSLINGSNSNGYKILMNRMQTAILGIKTPMMGGMLKWILGIGLAAVVGYALLTGG